MAYVETRLLKYIPAKLRPYVVWLDFEKSSHVYFLTFEKDGIEINAENSDTVAELTWNAKQCEEELLGEAHELVWGDVEGVPENAFRVTFDTYSGYADSWSLCERDIIASSMEATSRWAEKFVLDTMQTWKTNKVNNRICLRNIIPIRTRPGFPSRAAAERELRLEGCHTDD